MNDLKYYLVLYKMPGNFNIVDITALDIYEKESITPSLLSIDNFTSKFSEKEIRASIERGNITETKYLDSPLRVQGFFVHDNGKYECKKDFKMLSKEILKIINEYRNGEIKFNQDANNKLYGHIKKIIEKLFKDSDFIKTLLDKFKIAIKENNKEEIFKIIDEIPSYEKVREIYFIIYELEIARRKSNIIDLNDYGFVEKLDE